MRIGKQMQFFGARVNIAKALLYAINGGVDERYKQQVGPTYQAITSEYLNYDEVMEKYDKMLEWLCGLYVNTLNVIHYMHDKYAMKELKWLFMIVKYYVQWLVVLLVFPLQLTH